MLPWNAYSRSRVLGDPQGGQALQCFSSVSIPIGLCMVYAKEHVVCYARLSHTCFMFALLGRVYSKRCASLPCLAVCATEDEKNACRRKSGTEDWVGPGFAGMRSHLSDCGDFLVEIVFASSWTRFISKKRLTILRLGLTSLSRVLTSSVSG